MSKSNAVAPAPAAKLSHDETVDRAACLCGCGGTPKGPKSRFIPGHDARYHAAQKAAAGAADMSAGAHPEKPAAKKPTEKPKSTRRHADGPKTAPVKESATDALPVDA